MPTCQPGYFWNGSACVKIVAGYNPYAIKPTVEPKPKSVKKEDKEIKELMEEGKKSLPKKEIPIKSPQPENIPFYGDISNAAQKDSFGENVAEFVDPTGVTSYDDAYRAKAEWDKSGNTLPTFGQGISMFGAVPVLGKLGKLKYLDKAGTVVPQGFKTIEPIIEPTYKYLPWQEILNKGDAVKDIIEDNLKVPTVQSTFNPQFIDAGPKYLNGGPLVDKTNHGKLLQSVYASALGNYYGNGGFANTCPQGYHWDPITQSCVSNFFTTPPITKSIDPLDVTKNANAVKTLTNPITKKSNTIEKVNSNSSIPKVQHIENSLDKPLSLPNNLKEFDNKVNSLVTTGDAARVLKDAYFSKDNTKSLEQLTREALTSDSQFLQKIEADKMEEFKKNEQKAYDEAGILQKTGNAVSAFMADPILTGSNLMSGQRPLMGQSGALRDEDNNSQKYYRQITGADNNIINDLVNIINPASYATSAGVNADKGNYTNAVVNLGEAFMAGADLKQLGELGVKGINYVDNIYNKVATGNSSLPVAWKVEKPLTTPKSSEYITRKYTDKEIELLNKYGRGMGKLTPEDWVEMEKLTKSGATDFSKKDIPISRLLGYYVNNAEEINAIKNLKWGQSYKYPADKNIRTWSASVEVPTHQGAQTRLVIPSKYTKDLGNEFAAMPYNDKRVDFIWDSQTGKINSNAVREKELMGNIPEGFKVIGKSKENGLNNIIIKPVKNKNYANGGQFENKYSLPEDSFKKGVTNLHNSVYASSLQQYPAVYELGGLLNNNLSTRQQMYMPLDHIERNGGSILSMSNTPQLEGAKKDLTVPENAYIYTGGGNLNNNNMSINIKPENKGKFTASANQAGMGVQEYANRILANKEDYSSTLVKRANFAHNAAGWKHANGGPMEQLTEFNEGGKHEENSLGGIPQGVAPDGQPNLVEQGETKLNSDNYIFSDNLKVDKEVAESFNLPKTAVGKTFATVSKQLNKPNSRREGDTIEDLDTKKNLDKLMNAQEAFKQFEVQRKLEEINSLDPNLLGSLMGQGQLTPMQPEQQQAEQLQQPIDPSMVQQMTDENGGAPMMKLGGYMYGEGGGLNYTVSNPKNLQGPSTEFMYPISAINAVQYPSIQEAQDALLKGENDATRTYFQYPGTQIMGELIGNQDVNNPNFQDWGPNKSNEVVTKNVFYGDNTPTVHENRKDLGGWLQDNKQGVLGGLQAAAGIGAMFIPGAQGLGTNLISGGAKNIMGEVVQDNQPKVNPQQVVQNTNLPVGINFALGGPLNNGFNPNPNTEVVIDPITGLDINAVPNITPLNITPVVTPKVINKNSYQNVEIPGVENFNSGTNMIPSSYFQNNENQPNEEQIELTPDDDDYYDVNKTSNNILVNPSQMFSGNYQGVNPTTTTNRTPGSGVYTLEYLTALERAKQELGDNNVNLDITQKPWELALQGLPVAYNTARGLFEKPMQLKASDYMQKPIQAYKMNVDPQLAATREAYAGASAGLKNNMPGQGAYLTNRSSIANSEAQAKRDIYVGKENADNQLKLNADIQNAQLLGQNNQNKMAIQQFNAQAKEAKKQLLGAGLVQGSQIGRASVDTNLQKEMMKLVAPSFTEWLKTQNKSKV